MRLNENERSTLLHGVSKHFGDDCVAMLFGSRVDDTRRGGDIDLHEVAGHLQSVDLLTEIRCKVELEEALGDQKVDLIVGDAGSPQQPFDAGPARDEWKAYGGSCSRSRSSGRRQRSEGRGVFRSRPARSPARRQRRKVETGSSSVGRNFGIVVPMINPTVCQAVSAAGIRNPSAIQFTKTSVEIRSRF